MKAAFIMGLYDGSFILSCSAGATMHITIHFSGEGGIRQNTLQWCHAK